MVSISASISATAQDDLQERVSPSPPALISEQIKVLCGFCVRNKEFS